MSAQGHAGHFQVSTDLSKSPGKDSTCISEKLVGVLTFSRQRLGEESSRVYHKSVLRCEGLGAEF